MIDDAFASKTLVKNILDSDHLARISLANSSLVGTCMAGNGLDDGSQEWFISSNMFEPS